MTTSLLRRAGAALVAATLLLPAWAAPATIEAGAALPPLQLTDQFDRPLAVTASTRLLVFTADKAGNELAQSVLKAQEAGVMARLQAVYVADISGMPALVTQLFAMPKLKELPFAVGIVRDAALTAFLPRQPGQVAVLTLDAGQVVQVRLAADAPALKQALGLQ